MPIVAETTYGIRHSATTPTYSIYEYNIPPSDMFAKVALTELVEYAYASSPDLYDGQYSIIRIKSIKRKRSDGLIETVDKNSNAAYDPKMTNITVYVEARGVEFKVILIMEYWG